MKISQLLVLMNLALNTAYQKEGHSNASISAEEIELQFEQYSIKCVSPKMGITIFRNDEEYTMLMLERGDCTDTLPFVDFSENIFIGYRTVINSCNIPEMTPKIVLKNGRLQVQYWISQFGDCLDEHTIIRWFKVPLIDPSVQIVGVNILENVR